MTVAENTLHPLQIEDARDAAYRASVLQSDLETEIKTAGDTLADAEEAYRVALLTEMKSLHDRLGVGWSTCEVMAKGDKEVARLRKARDNAQFAMKMLDQRGFRLGADRRTIDRLVEWSQKRDLRTEPEPGQQPSWTPRAVA